MARNLNFYQCIMEPTDVIVRIDESGANVRTKDMKDGEVTAKLKELGVPQFQMSSQSYSSMIQGQLGLVILAKELKEEFDRERDEKMAAGENAIVLEFENVKLKDEKSKLEKRNAELTKELDRVMKKYGIKANDGQNPGPNEPDEGEGPADMFDMEPQPVGEIDTPRNTSGRSTLTTMDE